MTTVVPGLVKIGRTRSDCFDGRMYSLERNGYGNVTGLQRRFAIEVEDYAEKEALLDEIFSKSRVPGSELFALDIDVVVQLLSSLDGRQIYPPDADKEAAFDKATAELRAETAPSQGPGRAAGRSDLSCVPDGRYLLRHRSRSGIEASAVADIISGVITVRAGAACLPRRASLPSSLAGACIVGGVLDEDVTCSTPSAAAALVIGGACNGWDAWRDTEGRPLSTYRLC